MSEVREGTALCVCVCVCVYVYVCVCVCVCVFAVVLTSPDSGVRHTETWQVPAGEKSTSSVVFSLSPLTISLSLHLPIIA